MPAAAKSMLPLPLLSWAAFPDPHVEARYRRWVLTSFRLQFDLLWSALDLLSSFVIMYRLLTWSAASSYLLLIVCDVMITSIVPLLVFKARPMYLATRTPLLATLRILKTLWTAELNRKFFRPYKHHMRIMKLLSTGPASYCMLATFGWQLPLEVQLLTGAASTTLSLTYVLDICNIAFRSTPSTAFVAQCYEWIDYGNALSLSAVTGFNVGAHALSSDPCLVVQRWVMTCWGMLLPTMLLAVLELWFFRMRFLLRDSEAGNPETERMLSALRTKLVLMLVLLGWFLSLTWQVVLLLDGTAPLKSQDGTGAGWRW